MAFAPSRSAYVVLATVAGIFFFILAVTPGVYEETTPHLNPQLVRHSRVAKEFDLEGGGLQFLGSTFRLSFHVAVRKIYSVIAFALLAFLLRRAAGWRRRRLWLTAGYLALYSAAIEVGQYFTISVYEGLGSNLFDVLCGALGGLIGGAVGGFFPPAQSPESDVTAA